jgi:hypothetical protein
MRSGYNTGHKRGDGIDFAGTGGYRESRER